MRRHEPNLFVYYTIEYISLISFGCSLRTLSWTIPSYMFLLLMCLKTWFIYNRAASCSANQTQRDRFICVHVCLRTRVRFPVLHIDFEIHLCPCRPFKGALKWIKMALTTQLESWRTITRHFSMNYKKCNMEFPFRGFPDCLFLNFNEGRVIYLLYQRVETQIIFEWMLECVHSCDAS